MENIRFNRVRIIDRSHPTRIQSKQSDYQINGTQQPNSRQIKIEIDETTNLCVPPDYDLNYFLARGTRKTIINKKCQLGLLRDHNNQVELGDSNIQFEGKVTYEFKSGLISRKPMNAYINQSEPIIIPNPNCDPNFNSRRLHITGKGNDITDLKGNSITLASQTGSPFLPLINNSVLDPFGNPGVIECFGESGFYIDFDDGIAGNWCLEFWVKVAQQPTLGGTSNIFNCSNFNYDTYQINYTNLNYYYLYANNLNPELTSYQANFNSWDFIQIQKIGNNVNAHLNGTLIPNSTFSTSNSNLINNPNNRLYFSINGTTFSGLYGYLSDIRITQNLSIPTIIPTSRFNQGQCQING